MTHARFVRHSALAALVVAAGSVSALAQDAKPAAPAEPKAPVAVPLVVPKADPKPEPTLKVGMPAPEFKVEKFLKGTPITGLEKGQIYVVEFWATWCGPCIASMPHISELQAEFKNKGVTIIGVNIWEERTEYTEETLKRASDFVQKKGDGMAYTVAFDGAAKHMDTVWMKAAGRNGIPSAFVVDQKGIIAWMGHPMELDMVLDEVTAGKWDMEKGPERIKEASKSFRDATAKYKDGVAPGDEAWNAAAKEYPIMAKTMTGARFRALVLNDHKNEAVAMGRQMLETGKKSKNTSMIMDVFSSMAPRPSNPSQPAAPAKPVMDGALLLAAAQANFDLSDQTEPSPHIVMARAYYATGDLVKGKAAAVKAVELEKSEESKPQLEAFLKRFEDMANAEAAPAPAAAPAAAPAPAAPAAK